MRSTGWPAWPFGRGLYCRRMQALSRTGPLGAAFGLSLVLALAALAAPGDLDSTFGVNGRVVLSPGIESYATAAATQPDGKILLAGHVDDQERLRRLRPRRTAYARSTVNFLAARLNRRKPRLDLRRRGHRADSDRPRRRPLRLRVGGRPGPEERSSSQAMRPRRTGIAISLSSGTRRRAHWTRAFPATASRR